MISKFVSHWLKWSVFYNSCSHTDDYHHKTNTCRYIKQGKIRFLNVNPYIIVSLWDTNIRRTPHKTSKFLKGISPLNKFHIVLFLKYLLVIVFHSLLRNTWTVFSTYFSFKSIIFIQDEYLLREKQWKLIHILMNPCSP